MKINQIKNTPDFKGLYNNKLLLSGLEKISDHSASFALGVSFVSAMALRPLVISLAPKVDNENKKNFSADSIASALIKLVLALGVSLPIEKTVENIEKNKDAFLSSKTLKKLSDRDFKFITQIIKQSSNLISSIPKSVLSVALIPVILDLLNFKKDQKTISTKHSESFSNFKDSTSFKGKYINKIVTSAIESDKIQDFAKKYSYNDKNIARNFSVLNDVLLAITSSVALLKSNKVKEERKKPLILNKLFSTSISVLAGCFIDKTVQELGSGFVEKFSEINKNDKKLMKYIEGINVLRPTIVFALVYYGIIPFMSAIFSDKLSNVKNDGN